MKNVRRFLLFSCFAQGLALATSPLPLLPDPIAAVAADLDRALGQGVDARNLSPLQAALSGYAVSETPEFREAALAWLVKHDACFTNEEARPLFQAFRNTGVTPRLSSAAGQAEAGRAQRALEAQDRRAWLHALTELPAPALLARLSGAAAQQHFLGAARAACGSSCTGQCSLVWRVTTRIEPASRSASSVISPEFFEQLYRLSRLSAP
jgi:hypothetical protein